MLAADSSGGNLLASPAALEQMSGSKKPGSLSILSPKLTVLER